jgi:hypothetical protein
MWSIAGCFRLRVSLSKRNDLGGTMIEVISAYSHDTIFTGTWDEVVVFINEWKWRVVQGNRWHGMIVVA